MIEKFITKQEMDAVLPKRNCHTHKGDYGKILLLCGSKGYTGAAALAALGALRSGAGLVYLGVPESIYEIEAIKLLEPVVFSLPDQEGMFDFTACDVIEKLLPKIDAVLVGPGIGRSEGSLSVVRTVLEKFKGPVVVDADGINVLSSHKYILRDRNAPTIVTPHDGEFVRIGGVITSDRVASAAVLAVITDGNICYVNQTGNPGMAVGGAGDVLSGIIVSLLGQGISPLLAAACAAWLHGAAGDICAQEIGQYGMLPQDKVNVLQRLLP